MTSCIILVTAEYLNAHFFSVFLFVYAPQVLKVNQLTVGNTAMTVNICVLLLATR